MRFLLIGFGLALLAVSAFSAKGAELRFEVGANYSVWNDPVDICVGDFNSDRHPDLAVANELSHSITVLQNDGTGTFSILSQFGSLGNYPVAVHAVDVDNDRRHDIAVANSWSNAIQLFRNLGQGSFQPAGSYLVPLHPSELSSADVDKNGGIDLIVANEGAYCITLLFNDGEGQFTSQESIAVPRWPISISTGDFDNNQWTDIAVASSSDSVSILLNVGYGQFVNTQRIQVGVSSYSVASLDFDHDGLLDLVTTGPVGKVTLLHNNGVGDFAVDNVLDGQPSYRLTATEFSNDDLTDIVVASSSPAGLLFFENQGGVTFSAPISIELSGTPMALCTGDWDSDGLQDVATANAGDTVSTIMNRSGTPLQLNSVYFRDEQDSFHVVSNMPALCWEYDAQNTVDSQLAYSILLTSDSTSSTTLLWSSGTVFSSSTCAALGSVFLLDGHNYYLKLRLFNGSFWTPWRELNCRLNSVPSNPIAKHPTNDYSIDNQLTLWVDNATDNENDPLLYDFRLFVDTAYGEPELIEGLGIPAQSDSTGWTVAASLQENARYHWQARSYDGYEYSDWTSSVSFYLDQTPEAPAPYTLISPPLAPNVPEFHLKAAFDWVDAPDPDPFDTVRYTLEISISPNFTFTYTLGPFAQSDHLLVDSLEFNTHYWWRVKATDKDGFVVASSATHDFWTWLPGDVDYSHNTDGSDLQWWVDFMYFGMELPSPRFVLDLDGDCVLDGSDSSILIDYIFFNGPPWRGLCVP